MLHQYNFDVELNAFLRISALPKMVQLGGKPYEPESTGENLREERRRTGKFIAAGSAIFLSLLGLYQALTRGTPEYAALLAPALIMFIYIAWVLYVSTKRNGKIIIDEHDSMTETTKNSVQTTTITDENVELGPKINNDNGNDRTSQIYGRSYSIG